jgi:integrase
MRKTMTDKGVAALKPRSSPYPDPQMASHYVRVRESGSKSFVCQARDPYGKQIWHTTGSCDVLRIEESRDLARAAIKRIKQGLPTVEPTPAKPDSFRSVAEGWLKRHVAAKKMRTEYDMRRNLEKYVYPHWADRDFISIKRSDVAALLDRIEDESGSRTADLVRSYASSIASWYALRNDNYVSPFAGIRGLRRNTKPPRSRVLDDPEIRIIWKAAEANGKFGAFIKLLLLCGQRSEKVRTMRWQDLDDDGTWTIRTSDREKPNAGSLILPPLALSIIRAQPRINEFVFAGRRDQPMDISNAKYQFDEKLPSMPGWVPHDCRRTCRSMLSRLNISHETSERILGHRVGTHVSRIYDRHKYDLEKKIALEKLAQLISNIVDQRGDNVVTMAKRKNPS